MDGQVRATTSIPLGRSARIFEEHAAILRQRAKLGHLDRLDPRRLAPEFRLTIAYPQDINGLATDDLARLCGVDAKEWSGMGVPLPEGRLLVLLHPNQTPGRANVTIMEEVSHAYYRHSPTQLFSEPSGIQRRAYNKAAEREAYWTAAAALLPAHAITKAVWRGESIGDIAERYGASEELVEFRVKILGLWSDYASRLAKTRKAP